MVHIDGIKKRNEKNIGMILNCIHKYLEQSQKNIQGFYGQAERTQEQIDKIVDNSTIVIDLEWLDIDKLPDDALLFSFEKTQRFLPVCLSKLYEGSLKLSSDDIFLSQIREKFNNIDVDIDKSGVKIYPAYDSQPTLLFHMTHSMMQHLYFAIVKYSPKGYKIYFLYDIFSEVCAFKKASVYAMIDALYSEQRRYTAHYSEENITNAVILHDFQKEILSTKENRKKSEKRFETLFSVIDSVRAQIEENVLPSKTLYTVVSDAKSVLDSIFEEMDIGRGIMKPIEKLNAYVEEFIYLQSKQSRSIEQLDDEIASLKMELEDKISSQREGTEKVIAALKAKIKTIETILQQSRFSYQDLTPLQQELPMLAKLGSAEERIENLKKLINMSKQGSMVEKIKSYFSTYSKELEVENDNLISMKNKLKEDINELKIELDKQLQSKIEESKKQDSSLRAATMNKIAKLETMKLKSMDDRKMDSEREKKKFMEFKEDVLVEIDGYYGEYDKEWKSKLEAMKNDELSLMQAYKAFFESLPKVNYVEFFNNIEKLYLAEYCDEELLPLDLQNFMHEMRSFDKQLQELLDIQKHYNENLERKLDTIKEKIASFAKEGSIEKGVIEAVEETIVKDMALIY